MGPREQAWIRLSEADKEKREVFRKEMIAKYGGYPDATEDWRQRYRRADISAEYERWIRGVRSQYNFPRIETTDYVEKKIGDLPRRIFLEEPYWCFDWFPFQYMECPIDELADIAVRTSHCRSRMIHYPILIRLEELIFKSKCLIPQFKEDTFVLVAEVNESKIASSLPWKRLMGNIVQSYISPSEMVNFEEVSEDEMMDKILSLKSLLKSQENTLNSMGAMYNQH